MTDRVKSFIESNIDLIHVNTLEQLFHNWYTSADADDFWTDPDDVRELISILKNIDFDEQTIKTARIAVIENYIDGILDKLVVNAKRLGNNEVRWRKVSILLRSTLGLSNEEFNQIMNDIDKSGLTPDYENRKFVITD